MKTLEEIRARLAELQPRIKELGATEELSDEQRTEWDAATTEWDELDTRRADLEDRAARAAAASSVSFNVNVTPDSTDILEDRSATPAQLGDALVRSLEERVDDSEAMTHVQRVVRKHRRDRNWVRNLLARTTDAYEDGFFKYLTGRSEFWTEEERAAMAVGTNTAGGFLVPTFLDPTIILTNNGAVDTIRPISRVVTLTSGNVWQGITSAGVTASWDAELAEVSDDTPAVANVTVPIYKAQAFVQASIEAFEDVDGLEADLRMMLADARERLESTAHATGSGSGQPTGIFTALDANTNVELTSATAATIGLVDLQTAYRSVPVRWRGRSTWLMNPLYLLAVQALGTAVSASYSTDLTEPLTDRIIGKPVVESDDAPTTQTTTVRDNEIIFGDFSNYLLVDKPGSASIEFIPHLFNTANNLPDGRRGFYMHWRHGADSVNDLAFRLLQDKTSA